LYEEAKKLPIITLEKLVELSIYSVLDTKVFFETVLTEAKSESKNLPDSIVIQDKIAYRKVKSTASVELTPHLTTYPQNREDKKSVFNGVKHYRQNKAKMMDKVYEYFSNKDEGSHLAVEAPSGMGKTFGYLFPTSYHTHSTGPVLISTYTITLQQQIIEKEMKELKKVLPFLVTFAVLKSSYHYIDIDKWKSILSKKDLETAEALYSMRVLVWLTQTYTGDLDELNIQNDPHQFWETIRHKSQPTTKKTQPHTINYYQLSREKASEATFVITNHSYLSHQLIKEEKDLPQFGGLIIDEAHRFSDVAQQTATKTFHYFYVYSKLKMIGSPHIETSLLGRLVSHLNKETASTSTLDILKQASAYLYEELDTFGEEMVYFLEKHHSTPSKTDILYFSPEQMNLQVKKVLKNTVLSLSDYIQLGFNLIDNLLKNNETISLSLQFVVDELFDSFSTIMEQKEVLENILWNPSEKKQVFWCRYDVEKGIHSLSIHSFQSEEENEVFQKLKQIPSVLYVSSTLSVDNNFQFFKQMMQNTRIETMRLASDFSYKENTRIFLPKEVTSIKELSRTEHAKVIAKTIRRLAEKTEENMLVLFTSHETLKETYQNLSKEKALLGREILAQSISGTREKIAKRFYRARGGIVLGAESFWEGIDLPGDSLHLVIVTRLPFDFRNRPLVQARYRQLRNQNKNPFAVDALPRATMRLKQSYGRLLRSETDKGIFILLDDRIKDSPYSDYLKKAFPKEMSLEILKMAEIEEICSNFFKKIE